MNVQWWYFVCAAALTPVFVFFAVWAVLAAWRALKADMYLCASVDIVCAGMQVACVMVWWLLAFGVFL